MIKYAQELLRINGFKINERVFMHGFSASAKFCNRYSFLHPEMVKAVAAGGVNGLPTLPIREWNECELPFPIGIAGIERFIDKPFNEKAFRQVAHYIYMGSFDRNDTLPSRDAWREEEADIIKKALAEKMMPDRWELSRKIYSQQKIPSQLVTYNGVAHAIKGEMQDDVTDFFKANSEEKFVRIKPYEYPFVKFKEIRPKYKSESTKVDIAIEDKNLTVTKQPDGSFRAEIAIYNKGSYPLPQFGVNFYAGDPDKGGRLLASHAAGPIMPGAGWGEYNPRLKLRPGENTISVVVDPGNKVEESDETNNKASQTISTTVKVKPAESKVPAEMVGTWFFDNPRGDEEQMAVFPDGRVVVLYSNGHKDQTNFINGFIELAEYNNAKCRMAVREDGTLVQYFDLGGSESIGKRWRRIAPEPHTNLLRSLTGPSEDRGKFFVTLPNDVTVELVGVCDWPQEGRRCWQPDGSKPLRKVYVTKWNVSPGFGDYGFILKVNGPEDLNFSWNKIEGTSGWEGSCKVVDAQENQLEGFEAAISDMKEGQPSTTIRIGIAAGPWTTIATHDGKQMRIAKQSRVLWSQAFQTYSGTHIVASCEWRKDRAERVVAVDKEGILHTTGHGSVASGKIDQLTASFRNLKLGQIGEFQYQVRPYQWVEFKNVSLRPGHKTDVQF
jgi:hypothetical protein